MVLPAQSGVAGSQPWPLADSYNWQHRAAWSKKSLLTYFRVMSHLPRWSSD